MMNKTIPCAIALLMAALLLCISPCLFPSHQEKAPAEKKSPLVLAHRGLVEFAPENSIPAVKEALKRGADGCEVDVHLSATGDVMVLHDPAVNRVTRGKGLVKELTLAQLKALRLKPDPGNRYPDETVPTLQELFQAIGCEPVLFIEMKRPRNMAETSDGMEEKVGAVIDRFDRYDTTFVSSFNPRSIAKLKEAWPKVKTVFEYHQGIENVVPKPDWLEAAGDVYAIGPKVSAITPELVEWARGKAYRLSTFSPITLDEMELVAGLGFDIIQTHRPELYNMVQNGMFEPEGLAGIPPVIRMGFDGKKPEDNEPRQVLDPRIIYTDAFTGKSCLAVPVAQAAGAYTAFPAKPETLYLLMFHVKADRRKKIKGVNTHIYLFEMENDAESTGGFTRVNRENLPSEKGIVSFYTGPSYFYKSKGSIDENGWMRVRFAFRSRYKTRSLRLLFGASNFFGRLLLDELTLRELPSE